MVKTVFAVPVLVLVLALCSQALAFSVSGVVRYEQTGAIYINLVDQEAFQGRGGQGLVLLPPAAAGGTASGEMAFRFENVSPGIYGLRCFQDLDGDKSLGMGLFGPTEPWAMSWRNKRPFGRPSFEDVAFHVRGNVSGIVLVLEE